MNKNIQSQVMKIFYQVLADAKTDTDMELILKSLLTEKESLTLAKRLAIAVFLDKGQSYEHIHDTLQVSSATIAGVAESMNKKGMQMALARVKAEEWADVWSIRISRALEKLMKT
ncbi:MAG: hypothetical protein DPW11_03055 [bacterium]|nr:hypothetical protein [Candidatus Microgenomates bacterium CPR3]MCQ3944729.1 hypothetical protein [bacterium]RIK52160.1 MAG: hypothetical protein DCC61_00025 [Candidatus Microgenomates bacterium]